MFEVGCPILTIDLKIVHRRDGDRNRKLYYREQHNRPPDSQGIWDFKIHGAYGCNKIERFVWVIN